jgi:predicted  nucleic acid-binding Zn-ribbon protein
MQTRPTHAGFPGVIEAEHRFPGPPFQRDQFAAARERQRHRDALQREVDNLNRQIDHLSAQAERLIGIRQQIQAQLAKASA